MTENRNESTKQPLEVSLRSLSDGPEQVFEYLGRYTHRVAITNNQIVSIEDGRVTFSDCDRSDENKIKELTVKAGEFIRRFLLHILPGGFMKIRYDGFLAHANKKALSVKRPSVTRAWTWGCHLA